MEAALSEVLVGGPLEIRPHEHAATLNGRALRLTRHEFGLLIALASRPGAVLGRQELAEQAWGRPLRTHDRSVDVYVRRLRQKLAGEGPGGAFIPTHFRVRLPLQRGAFTAISHSEHKPVTGRRLG